MTKKERRDSNPHSLVIVLSVVRLSLSNILFKKTTKNCCFIPIMYGFVCVLFYRSQQSCQRRGTSGSPLHFVSLRLRQHGVWRGSFDGTWKMR